MLFESPRHSKSDLVAWRKSVAMDARMCATEMIKTRIAKAQHAVADFVDAGPCYTGVSWGKDSVVVAHLVRVTCPDVPLVWIRVEPIKNPDCEAVRDLFLAQYPGPYEEIEEWCAGDHDGWHATGTLERGFKVAAERYGRRHISGIRGEESASRKVRGKRWGVSSSNTCAPLQWWTGLDVFAHLHKFDLPVHPAYAMSFGGMLRRERIRVSSLGGKRGTGREREQWEKHYYGTELELCARMLKR